MARIWFTSAPLPGHLDWGGLLKTAQALRAAGHDVLWVSEARIGALVERAGVPFAAIAVIGLVVTAAYEIVLIRTRGATLGQSAVGIRVRPLAAEGLQTVKRYTWQRTALAYQDAYRRIGRSDPADNGIAVMAAGVLPLVSVAGRAGRSSGWSCQYASG